MKRLNIFNRSTFFVIVVFIDRINTSTIKKVKLGTNSDQEAEWLGSFPLPLFYHSCLSYADIHFSPPCSRSVASYILSPVFPGHLLIYRAALLLLTCRLPSECIICELCPIQIEPVSCWLPVLAHCWMLGNQIWCYAKVTRWSCQSLPPMWDNEDWIIPVTSETLNESIANPKCF